MIPPVRWTLGVALAAAGAALVSGGAYRPLQLPEAGVGAAGIAAALCAVMILLGVVRPWWGLLLFLAAMPIVNVARAQVWIGAIQVIPGTLVITALVLGVVLSRLPHQHDVPPRPGRRTWLILGLAAVLAALATWFAPDWQVAANITLHGVLEPMAAFGVVIAVRPRPRQALHALVAVAVGLTIGTAINLAWLALVVNPIDFYEQRMLLARLTYYNPGIFGNMLVMALPAAASLLFLRRWVSRPRPSVGFAWLAIGLMVVGLFFTYTKSAWLSAALVASLMIVLLVRTRRRRIPLLLAVAVLLAVVVPYPLAPLRAVAPGLAAGYESLIVALQGEGRIESWDPDTYQGSGSIGIRLEAIGAAAELTAGTPLFGVGPGGFQREFARIRPDASVPELQSAHNLLPNLAAEYGLPFALIVAAGLLWAIRAALSARRSSDPLPRVVGTALGVSLIGFLSMATLFGVDLYRTYRTMNLDVMTAALLAGVAYSVASAVRSRLAADGAPGPDGGQPVDQPA